MSKPIDISPAQLDIVRGILRANLPETAQVWVFGSRAKWTAKNASDLDLAVDAGRQLTLSEEAALASAFEESVLPFSVDVADLHRVSNSFRAIIEKDRVPLPGCGRMGEWRPSTWGDEVTLNYGKAIRGYQAATKGFRVYGSNGPVGWHDKALSDGPGVILGRKGAYRGVEFSPGPFFVIDTAYYVTPKGEMDMRWLYYAIKHHRLGEIDDGSPIPSTTRAAVYNRDFEVPSFGEQKAIANVLSSLDDKIELNRRMNVTLEGMAQAIFRDWFVDFGPVRRKLAGASDAQAILGGLIPNPAQAAPLAALFPDTLGDDGLPVGWEMAPLEATLVLQRGFDLPKTTRTDGQYAVIAASGPSGTHNEFKVHGPGVCTGRSGVLGNVYFVDDDFWPLNTSLWIKSFPNSTPLYAYYILREIDLGAFNAGSAVPTLNRNHIHGLPITKPPMPIIHGFDKLGMLCYGKMAANEVENRTLAETRDYLLPRLMSGKVRVADAEREVA